MSFHTNIAKLSLTYKVIPDRRKVDVVFQVDRHPSPERGNIERAIVSYSDVEIRMFFKFYLLELFSKSMLQIYTKVEELKFRNFRRG